MPGMSVEHGKAKPAPTGPSPARNRRRFRRRGSWTLQLHPLEHLTRRRTPNRKVVGEKDVANIRILQYSSKDLTKCYWSTKSRLEYGVAMLATVVGILALSCAIFGHNGPPLQSFIKIPFARSELGIFADTQTLCCYYEWTNVPNSRILEAAGPEVRHSFLGFAVWQQPRKRDSPPVVGGNTEVEVPIWFVAIMFAACAATFFRWSRKNRLRIQPAPEHCSANATDDGTSVHLPESARPPPSGSVTKEW
jgi:hypothetical protein